MVEVSTGQSLRISPSGDFGTVTKFQESDLNEDLHLINESMPTNETAGNSSSSGSFGSIGIIIGIAVAVVLLGGVSFGLNRRRRH